MQLSCPLCISELCACTCGIHPAVFSKKSIFTNYFLVWISEPIILHSSVNTAFKSEANSGGWFQQVSQQLTLPENVCP